MIVLDDMENTVKIDLLLLKEGIINDIDAYQNDFRYEIIERITFQNNNIMTLKSDINASLILFGFIVTLALFVATYVVNGFLKKTELLKEETNKLYNQILKIRDDVEITKEYIDKNSTSLYWKLLKEETAYMIDRIKVIPEEIDHFYSKLTTRNLDLKYFEPMANAYVVLRDMPLYYEESTKAMSLLVQHFPQEIFFHADSLLEEDNSIADMIFFKPEVKYIFKSIFNLQKNKLSTILDRKRSLLNLFNAVIFRGDNVAFLANILLNLLNTDKEKQELLTFVKDNKDHSVAFNDFLKEYERLLKSRA